MDIFPLLNLLGRTIDDKYYNNNNGIYEELILSNGGLPEFFHYRQLIEDKNSSEQKIAQILESESVSSKEELIKKWIHIANNDMLTNGDQKRKYLLDTLPNKFQAIDFYETLKDRIRLFDIRSPMDELSIDRIYRDGIYKYNSRSGVWILSWFNYMTGFGIWCIYVALLEENRTVEKKGLFGPKIIDMEDKLIFSGRDMERNKNMIPFKKFLEDNMNLGPFFLARGMDKTFETIYPRKISFFQFGPMLTKESRLFNGDIYNIGSDELLRIFEESSDAYFLIASREDIEDDGLCDMDNPIEKMIGTKCIWRTDKVKEQRFGVCSKGLEEPMKEFLKFPDMRLYVTR